MRSPTDFNDNVSTKFKPGVSRALAVALALAGGGTALTSQNLVAQALEEIVVTAQRREEGMQDVPVAVSALSNRDLEMRGISGISGLATGEVPSLNVQTFAGRPGVM